MESEFYRYGLYINPRAKIVGPRKIENWRHIFCYDPFCYNDFFVLSDGTTCQRNDVLSLPDEKICKEVEKLLADGKDPNASFGLSFKDIPLYAAAERGFVKTVEKLLEAGANPNGKEKGARPLYIAAKNGYVEIVRKLLEFGADPLAGTYKDYVVPKRNQKEIRRILLTAMKEQARKSSGQTKNKQATQQRKIAKRNVDIQKSQRMKNNVKDYD